VVQKYINQHEEVSAISSSINTIRIATLLTKERDVLIIGAMMRFGVGEAYLDNRCMGGMAAGIDLDQGVLKRFAYDFHHKRYDRNPTSGISFQGFEITYWSQVVALAAKTIQMTFPFYKLLGHDSAITPEEPVIIQINDAHNNVGLEQAYGPILANERTRKAFKDYDLLINNLRHLENLTKIGSVNTGFCPCKPS
jgi:hypothetical protein